MKQTRRGFLGRIAAAAAVVAVAPAVEAKAATEPDPHTSGYAALMDEYKRGLMTREEFLNEFPELRMPVHPIPHGARVHLHQFDYPTGSHTHMLGDDGLSTGRSVPTMPIGYLIHLAPGVQIPDGYLECDGREVSRQTYRALFDVFGTRWGPGDGVTTFNLPSLNEDSLRAIVKT